MPLPLRHPWLAFPPVAIHAEPAQVKSHPDYAAAKAGDAEAAARLVVTTYSSQAEREVRRWAGGRSAVLVPVHAVEEQGVNGIPVVLAEALGQRVGLDGLAAWDAGERGGPHRRERLRAAGAPGTR